MKNTFPINFTITEAIINTSDIRDVNNCIGARSLSDALKSRGIEIQGKVSWGAYYGYFYDLSGVQHNIATEKMVNMLHVTKPTEVTFVLKYSKQTTL